MSHHYIAFVLGMVIGGALVCTILVIFMAVKGEPKSEYEI